MGHTQTLAGIEIEICCSLNDDDVLFTGERYLMNQGTFETLRALNETVSRDPEPRNWDKNPVRVEALKFLNAGPVSAPTKRGIVFGALA